MYDSEKQNLTFICKPQRHGEGTMFTKDFLCEHCENIVRLAVKTSHYCFLSCTNCGLLKTIRH